MTLLEPHENPWRPRPSAAENDILCWLLEEAAAAAFGVSPAALRAPSRGLADVAFARQSAMYLAHVALGLSYSTVGKLFHRHRTTAAYACRLVEDRRDDPAIDILLDVLEAVCIEVFRGPVAPPPVRQ